jgi:hypothetical protein
MTVEAVSGGWTHTGIFANAEQLKKIKNKRKKDFAIIDVIVRTKESNFILWEYPVRPKFSTK